MRRNVEPARDLLDPKNDCVFKRLFVRAPLLLVALINAVRHAERPIRAVHIRNMPMKTSATAHSRASAPSVTPSPTVTRRGARLWRKASWKAKPPS
jgi:hypothetical protein